MATNKDNEALIETLKGKTVIDPVKYWKQLEDKLYEMDKAGLWDRNSKIDNQYFSAKEQEIKSQKEIVWNMVKDAMKDSDADEHRYDIQILVTKQQGVG
jgi:hypothetical protein